MFIKVVSFIILIIKPIIKPIVNELGQSELVTEECTALAFILDSFLPPTQTIGDNDCPALSRVLFAALASATHTPEVQQSLVNEVKSALHRALLLSESNEKHARIQSITALITTMIESCPSPAGATLQQTNQGSMRNQNTLMNGIVKNLLRKGLVTDLARVTHSLDLSSPNMANTVNAALKPLETLSRIVNIPPQMAVRSKPFSKPEQINTNTEAMEEDANAATSNAQQNTNQQNEQVERMNETPSIAIDGNAIDDFGIQTETSASDTNAFNPSDVTGDDNTDNEAVVLETMSFELYNDGHPRTNTFNSDDIRTDDDDEQDQTQTTHEEIGDETIEHHDNVVNGAESESGDSDSDEDDEDDDDGSAQDEERDDEEDDDDEDDERIDDDDDDGEEDDDDDDEPVYLDHDDIGEALFRYQDRDDGSHLVFDLEDMFPSSVIQVGERMASLLPIIGTEDHINGNDTTQPTVPPAPGNVTLSHPLLVRHGESTSTSLLPHSFPPTQQSSGILNSRSHRSGRQRMYRPSLGTTTTGHHNWHIGTNSHRHPNPPAILQRLLGPNTAQDILQLTTGMSSSNAPTQVILAGSDFHILATEEDFIELHNPNFISGSTHNTLSAVPSAMLRWTEESRVLDGDSLHDCVALIKAEIFECLEKHRDEELAERREKKKKEEELKKANEQLGSVVVEIKEATEQRIENEIERRVNNSTERLAASLVENVLRPVISHSSNIASESSNQPSTTPPASMDTTEPNNVNDNISQNDNEVSEMQFIPEHAVAQNIPEREEMEVNGDSHVNENVNDNINASNEDATPMQPANQVELEVETHFENVHPPQPERACSEEIPNVITPEDLSTVTNTSSENLVVPSNEETAVNEVQMVTASSAESAPANNIQDENNESKETNEEATTNQGEPVPPEPPLAPPASANNEFANILGGKKYFSYYI